MLYRDLVNLAGRIALRRGATQQRLTPSVLLAGSKSTQTTSVQAAINFSTSLSLASSKFRHSRKHIPVLYELWRRREEVGPEKPRHRSELPNWNYDAELFGFCKRLNEDWKRETLIEAFTEKAYADAEGLRRAKLRPISNDKEAKDDKKGDEVAPASSQPSVAYNSNLAKRGEEICRTYITSFLSHSLPAYPQEGVKAVCDFLLSDDLLGYVCNNMGTADLILSTEFPPAVKVFANVFKALVGGLDRDEGTKKAYMFVHDFVVTQLSGRDINQFWNITNPIGLLAETMKKPVEKGGAGSSGEPEPRIIWQTGVSTPLAAYKIGIYDSQSKKLLGQGGGETTLIAEQMAALDALYRLFGTADDRAPFLFGREARRAGLADIVESNNSAST